MLFLFWILSIAIVVARCEDTPEHHDINEMFPSFKETDQYGHLPEGSYVDITIDVEKLDLKKFKKKITSGLEKNHAEDVDPAKNMSRRTPVTWIKGELHMDTFSHISQVVENQLTIDLILQHVYMARNAIKSLENDKNFNSKDTAYRMGYIYSKLKKAYKAMINIIVMMHANINKYDAIKMHVNLHFRIIKLYVDFQYWYWVLIKMDGMYRDGSGPSHKPKLPKQNAKTGGLSVESDFYRFQKKQSLNYDYAEDFQY